MAEAGASTGLSWQEVSRYLNEMTAVLSLRDDKDAEAIMSLASAKQALQSIFGASEANGKRAIAELQQAVRDKESSVLDGAMPLEHLRLQLEQLQERKAQLMADVRRMAVEKDSSAASLQKLVQSTLHYKELQAALAKEQTAQVPRIRNALNLYATISGVRWNYDSDRIEGFVAPGTDAPVRPFTFDAGSMTSVQLADALWSTIEVANTAPVVQLP